MVLGAVAVALADAFAGAGLVVAPMKRDIKTKTIGLCSEKAPRSCNALYL